MDIVRKTGLMWGGIAGIILNAITFYPAYIHAEDAPSAASNPDAPPVPEKNRYATLTLENDGFASHDDQNYTSGIRVGFLETQTKPPILPDDIGDKVPLLATNSTTSTYYSLGQSLFTPTDIQARADDPRDRPWAAFLYGSIGMSTLKESHVDDIELTLGVVGPAALGEQTQKSIHNILGDHPPEGWPNQLRNEPGAMLAWDRRWPERFSMNVGDLYLTAIPDTGVTLGNIYTYANAGGILKLSSAQSRWSDQPLQVQPAISGTGFFVPSDRLEWELFGGAQGRAIARNIFLDGNSFTDSPSVDKKIFVGDLTAGFAFTYGAARLSYTVVYRTKEFEEQSRGTLFGGISLGYNF